MGIKFLDEAPQPTNEAATAVSTGVRFLDEPVTQQAQPTTQEPSALDKFGRAVGLTARAGLKGITSIPLAVGDVLAQAQNAANALTGRESRVAVPSESFNAQLTNVGLPEPKPGIEAYSSMGAEAAAGGGLPKVGISKVGVDALESTARQQATRAASNLLSAGVAGSVTPAVADVVTSTFDNPIVGLAAGIATGTIVGSGTGKLAFNVASPRNAPVTIEDVRKAASQSYKQMEDAGAAVRTDSVQNKLFSNIERSLAELNFNPKVVEAHRPIAQQIQNAQSVLNKPFVSFATLEQLRGEMSSLSTGGDTTAKMARAVVNDIDSYMSKLSPRDTLALGGGTAQDALKNLKDARTGWRNQARAQVLQDILENAQLRAEGSFASKGEKIQQGLLNLATNPEKLSMFSTKEQNIIKAATKTDDIEKILMGLGRLNPQRGTFQQAMAGTAAYNLDNPQGQAVTALAAGGFTADKALGAVRQRELKNIIDQIASGNLQAPKEGFAIPGLFGAIQGSK
jgi:hypothetical protein